MKEETVEEFKKKHFENYKNAVMETVKNNTTVLFGDDIKSLLQKPPLDSMDLIKCKFLELAKKHKIIIQADSLNRVLENYRKDVIAYLSSWQKTRIEELSKIVTSFFPKKESDVIKFNKGDVVSILDENKKEFARGIVNYSSDSCRKVLGCHSDNILEILGFKNYDAIITRDNITLL